jgi:hypothetical protein
MSGFHQSPRRQVVNDTLGVFFFTPMEKPLPEGVAAEKTGQLLFIGSMEFVMRCLLDPCRA